MANTSIRVDTVGLGINWALGETYRVQMDEGFIRQSDGLQLPIRGNNSIMTFSTPANPPQIANTIPTHTSTAPINITDISFTIDRSVGNLTVLGGNVFLNRQGSPNIVVKTFAVSNASITGNTVAFSVIGNLEASQTYFITSNANIFLDRDGFKNNAITNSSSFRFISPTAPTVTAFTPGNATVASRNFTNVAIDFDRTIFSNSGNLFLHNANTSAVIRRYPISSGLISNNKVTLDVVGNIAADGYYYITSNANVVMDVTQIKYPGLTNASTFTFKAPVSPYLESTVPTNATTSASRSLTTASFTLDRTVTAVSGNVYLYEQSSPNVLLKTWTIGSNVSFNNDRTFSVTVPQGMLAPTQAYYVTTDANIAKDLTHINFPGISTTGNTFTFTTDVAPLISTFSPTYMQAIDETNNTISFTMDRLVNKNVGNIYLYKNDIVNGNALVKTYNINSNLTLTDNLTISANVANTLLVMEKYYVTSDYDILSDYYTGEKFRGIINANTFVFTTAVDREYYGNEFRKLFPTNVPQITDANSASTYSITITMADAIGHIQQLSEEFASPAGWDSGTKTYTITGTKTSCNAILANLYYFPNKTVTSNSTLTYSQTKDSVLQKTLSFTLFGRASVVDFLTGDNNTYAIPEDSKYNFMPFYMYPQWDANVAVMFKSVDAYGNVVTSAGTFNANTAAGWTTPYDGVIHKTFSRPANISVYNSQLAEIRDIYYWLASDYTSNVKIDALVGIESTVSGNTLSGGTVYSGSNNYTITPSGEYTLLTSGTYSEDGSVSISLSITDVDQHPNITYNVQMQQISPDPGLVTGAFTSPGVGTRSWGSISDTQAKSAWNAISYYAPADYTGNILIGATITKIQTGQANVTLASNVAINLTNSASHNEYIVRTSTYGEGLDTIDYDILDQDTNSPTYYVTLTQISPDPATTPANIIVNSVDYGTTWSASGSKTSIVDLPKAFYTYPDYTGNVVFGLTMIKSSYNGNITQASNVAITFTNSGTPAEYSLAGGTYIEDTDKIIALSITDADTRFTNYYINLRQISPDPSSNVGNIILGSTYGTNVSIYANRATINSLTKTITPPADWTSNIVLGYTQIKSTIFGNITQADNVAVTYTNITSHTEYALPIASANVYSNVSYIIPQVISTGSGTVVTNANVELALLGNGSSGSSTINDSSTNAYSITNTGGVVYSTAQTKYNGTSLYFNGSSRLSLASNTNLQMPADFTWEFWVYPTISDARAIISYGGWGRFMLFTNGSYEITGGVGNFLASGTVTAASLNAWTHFAVTRQSNTVRIFRNGTLGATHTMTGTPESVNSPLNIGYYPNDGQYFTGYMENIVYVKGEALYTANFTPVNWNSGVMPIGITDFGINDLANNKSYSVTLSVNDNLANIYQGNVGRGNSWTITGTRANVNTLLSNISLRPGYYGNIRSTSFNYLQTQTTDSIPQANVSIPVTIYPIPPVPIIGTAVQASNIMVGYGSNITSNISALISFTEPVPNDSIVYYSATARSFGGYTIADGALANRIFQSNSGNILITGLTPGQPYQFAVNATSAYGNSAYSTNTNTITIYAPPGGPYIGTAVATSNSSATITYAAPPLNGGRTIQSYTAVSTPGNLIGTINTSGAGTIIVNGLSDSTSYTFTVYASHQDGNSSMSATSNSITTYANAIPTAPTILQAFQEPGNIANIQFTAPAYNGNSVITSYTAVSNIGNITATLNQSGSGFITLGNLSFGNTYNFTLYATNAFGNSVSSTSPNVRISTDTAIYFPGVQAYSFIEPRNYGSWAIQFPHQSGFTFEMWVYNTDLDNNSRYVFSAQQSSVTTGNQSLTPVSLRQSGTNAWIINGGPWTGGLANTSIPYRQNNTWQHIAIEATYFAWNVYIDGYLRLRETPAQHLNLYDWHNFRIGGHIYDGSASACFKGYIDEIRLANSYAAYGGSSIGSQIFDPAAVSTNFSATPYTKVLIKGNGTHLSNVITDSSTYGANIKIGGNIFSSTSAGVSVGSGAGNVWISLGQAKSI